jgi:hypothetical protein
MCGRGATSACAASGRTNVVTRIAATCPSLLPHRVAATRQCSLSKVQQLCGQSSRSADPRLAVRAVAEESVANRETDGSWGSGLGDARAHAATARSRSCPDGSERRPRGTASRVLRKDGSANKSLRRRVLGVACGGGRRLARSVRARVREGCRRGRRRVVGGGARAPRFTPAAAFRGRRARLAPFAGSAQYPLWSGARHQIRAARSV